MRRKRLLAERRRAASVAPAFAGVDVGYDPAVAPNPAEWLALDEGERISLAEAYHRRAGVVLPDMHLHATVHVVIENQIAMGDEVPTRGAVERLMGQGLDRHQAIHAAGSVLTDTLWGFHREGATAEAAGETFNTEMEALTVERWHEKHGEKEEEC